MIYVEHPLASSILWMTYYITRGIVSCFFIIHSQKPIKQGTDHEDKQGVAMEIICYHFMLQLKLHIFGMPHMAPVGIKFYIISASLWDASWGSLLALSSHSERTGNLFWLRNTRTATQACQNSLFYVSVHHAGLLPSLASGPSISQFWATHSHFCSSKWKRNEYAMLSAKPDWKSLEAYPTGQNFLSLVM